MSEAYDDATEVLALLRAPLPLERWQPMIERAKEKPSWIGFGVRWPTGHVALRPHVWVSTRKDLADTNVEFAEGAFSCGFRAQVGSDQLEQLRRAVAAVRDTRSGDAVFEASQPGGSSIRLGVRADGGHVFHGSCTMRETVPRPLERAEFPLVEADIESLIRQIDAVRAAMKRWPDR